MLNKEQFEALSAAVDVAYDGDEERAEMEGHARSGLLYFKAAVEAPRPTGARWAMVKGHRTGATTLMAVKGVTARDPNHNAVVMPEVDYDRMRTRLLALENFYEKYYPQRKLIDELLAIEATADIEVAQPKEVYVPTITAEETVGAVQED